MHMEKIEYKSGEALPLLKLSNYFSNPIDLEKDKRVSGLFAWAGLAAIIIGYDYFAIKTKKSETLTRAFWRTTEHPIKAIAPLTIWSALTIHLLFEKNIRRKKFGQSK